MQEWVDLQLISVLRIYHRSVKEGEVVYVSTAAGGIGQLAGQ